MEGKQGLSGLGESEDKSKDLASLEGETQWVHSLTYGIYSEMIR